MLGRKSINVSTIGQATIAARGAGGVLKETQDVGRAKETVADALGARTRAPCWRDRAGAVTPAWE